MYVVVNTVQGLLRFLPLSCRLKRRAPPDRLCAQFDVEKVRGDPAHMSRLSYVHSLETVILM